MKKYKLNINLDNNTTITTDTALPIPDKTSDLTNDSGFITTDTNYYPSRIYTSGLKISNSTGVSNTCALYVPYATTDDSGLVTTAAQTFSGTKTFVTLDGDTIGAVMPNTSGWTASRTIATTDDLDERIIELSELEAYVSLGTGTYDNSSAPTTESTVWTVAMFDGVNALTSTTINYKFVGAGMSGTGNITRETYLGYPALNFNMSGPSYIAYKANNKIYVYSLASGSSFDLQINESGTSSDIYAALGGTPVPDLYTHTLSVQGTQDFVDNSVNTLKSSEHTYRYMHNVRLYLADKILIRTNYMLSKTQYTSANIYPNTLLNLAKALNYAGATSYENAIPATGMVYINNNTTGMVTGIYSIGESANNIYATYLPTITSSGSDATIAVNVPTESTIQLSSIGTPTINAYTKAV